MACSILGDSCRLVLGRCSWLELARSSCKLRPKCRDVGRTRPTSAFNSRLRGSPLAGPKFPQHPQAPEFPEIQCFRLGPRAGTRSIVQIGGSRSVLRANLWLADFRVDQGRPPHDRLPLERRVSLPPQTRAIARVAKAALGRWAARMVARTAAASPYAALAVASSGEQVPQCHGPHPGTPFW